MECRGIFKESSKILLIHNAIVLDLEDSFIMGYGRIDKATPSRKMVCVEDKRKCLIIICSDCKAPNYFK